MMQLNQNKIIISKHAIQRREHQDPVNKDILIELVKQIDNKFNISKKVNNKYKIGFRNTVAIIEKKDESLILITAYGFKKYDYKIDNINLKVSISVSKEDRKSNKDKNRGVIYKIFRMNFLNKKVECGTISDISKSKNSRDRQKRDIFSYKLILDDKLFKKFENIPMNHYHLYFNDFEEISHIVHLENQEYILNDFRRKTQ